MVLSAVTVASSQTIAIPVVPSRLAREVAFFIQYDFACILTRPLAKNRNITGPIHTQCEFLLKFFERFGSGGRDNRLALCFDSLKKSQAKTKEACDKAVDAVIQPASKSLSDWYNCQLNRVQLTFIRDRFSQEMFRCLLTLEGLKSRLILDLSHLPPELMAIIMEYTSVPELFKSIPQVKEISTQLFAPTKQVVVDAKSQKGLSLAPSPNDEEIESRTKSVEEMFCLQMVIQPQMLLQPASCKLMQSVAAVTAIEEVAKTNE